jgi:hypothetical protein
VLDQGAFPPRQSRKPSVVRWPAVCVAAMRALLARAGPCGGGEPRVPTERVPHARGGKTRGLAGVAERELPRGTRRGLTLLKRSIGMMVRPPPYDPASPSLFSPACVGCSPRARPSSPPVASQRPPTAVNKLRIVTLGFGTARQRTVLERWTKPKPRRRTRSPRYGVPSCRGKSAGVAFRPMSDLPPGIPNVTIRNFCIAVPPVSARRPPPCEILPLPILPTGFIIPKQKNWFGI